jgi:DNA-binding transcriptional regulator YhcF (GntR family)
MEGWIKIHRKMLDWEWYNDNNTKVLFIHLLLTANHTEKKWQGKTILRGQKLTSLQHLANETNLSLQQIRTSLNRLKSTNEITTEVTNKYTLITIEKYSDYQDGEEKNNKQNNTRNNKRATNK